MRTTAHLRLRTAYPCVVYDEDRAYQWPKGATSSADTRAKEPVCLVIKGKTARYQARSAPNLCTGNAPIYLFGTQLLRECTQDDQGACSMGLYISPK